jgi:hypothetical protein
MATIDAGAEVVVNDVVTLNGMFDEMADIARQHDGDKAGVPMAFVDGREFGPFGDVSANRGEHVFELKTIYGTVVYKRTVKAAAPFRLTCWSFHRLRCRRVGVVTPPSELVIKPYPTHKQDGGT